MLRKRLVAIVVLACLCLSGCSVIPSYQPPRVVQSMLGKLESETQQPAATPQPTLPSEGQQAVDPPSVGEAPAEEEAQHALFMQLLRPYVEARYDAVFVGESPKKEHTIRMALRLGALFAAEHSQGTISLPLLEPVRTEDGHRQLYAPETFVRIAKEYMNQKITEAQVLDFLAERGQVVSDDGLIAVDIAPESTQDAYTCWMEGIVQAGDTYTIDLFAYTFEQDFPKACFATAKLRRNADSAFGYTLISYKDEPMVKEVRASSSSMFYPAKNAMDGKRETAWAPSGLRGLIISVSPSESWMEYTFARPVTLEGVSVFNGNGKSKRDASRSGSVRVATVEVNGQELDWELDYPLQNNGTFEQGYLYFDEPITTQKLRFTIKGTYGGRLYSKTCVAELHALPYNKAQPTPPAAKPKGEAASPPLASVDEEAQRALFTELLRPYVATRGITVPVHEAPTREDKASMAINVAMHFAAEHLYGGPLSLPLFEPVRIEDDFVMLYEPETFVRTAKEYMLVDITEEDVLDIYRGYGDAFFGSYVTEDGLVRLSVGEGDMLDIPCIERIEQEGDTYTVTLCAYALDYPFATGRIATATLQKREGSSFPFTLLSYEDVPMIEEVTTSSTLAGYPPEKALDDDPNTAWVPQNPQGDWIEFTFAQPITLQGMTLFNGYGKSEDLRRKNNRVRIATIEIDGEEIEWQLPDPLEGDLYTPEYLTFDEPITTQRVRFTIDSIYEGTAYDDTCITELRALPYFPIVR